MMIPAANGLVPKELMVDMVRPNALRPDANWQATLSTLPPHQMLVLVLSKDATNKFAAWNRMSAIIPSSVERDGGDIEKLRYYRLVLPMEPDKPALSSHPLTWTTISHAIWDGYPPDSLSFSQQQALLDWLHWGGQLILSGGAGQSYLAVRESFLGPYLPADATGETVPLDPGRPAAACAVVSAARNRPNPDDQSQPVPLTTEEAASAVRVSISGAGADPTGAEAPALPVGTQGKAGGLDDSPGRGEPSSAGGRAAGRPRTDHDAHDQPQRRGSARLAGPRYAGPPGRAAAAGRADRRRSRVRRVSTRQPPQSEAVCSPQT